MTLLSRKTPPHRPRPATAPPRDAAATVAASLSIEILMLPEPEKPIDLLQRGNNRFYLIKLSRDRSGPPLVPRSKSSTESTAYLRQ